MPGNDKIYQGIVETGRGAAVLEMSTSGNLKMFQRFFGMPIIPGTLNLNLTEPFNYKLLNYVSFEELGWIFTPSKQGIKYDGEIGMHYGWVKIADKYPACIIFFTWVGTPHIDAEVISPYHLRTSVGLKDGDSIEFTLIEKPLLK